MARSLRLSSKELGNKDGLEGRISAIETLLATNASDLSIGKAVCDLDGPDRANAAPVDHTVDHQRPAFRAGDLGKLRSSLGGWLGNLDSNQDKQSQSLLCYRYTIPQ